MTRFPKWFTVVAALVALSAASGCEKRPTGFDPNPDSPEGVAAANARLVSYRNLGLRVMVRDYASTNIDSVVTFAQAFPGATSMPLLLLLDGTVANSFEMYRRDGAGRFERTGDYTLHSTFKYVNVGYESFFTTDPAPGDFTPSSYMGRGLVDGVASHQSPLSNESRLTQAGLSPIIYNGDRQPLDSLFTISWVGVPGAVGYWVHIYEKPISGLQRLISSLPAPIVYTTAGDLLLAYREGNAPGASVQFQLGDPTLLTLKSRAPLVGRDYMVRVSGVDASGQMIAQTVGDRDSVGLSADLVFLAPPTFGAEKTKIFFSLGGTKVSRRPPVRGPAGVTAEPPPAAQSGLERHIAPITFPYTTPAVAASAAGRAGWR